MAKRFDTIVTNPPFQDRANRGKTRHKLWLEFTRRCLDDLLVDGGHFCQVSPSSFRSPSSAVLDYFRNYRVGWIDLTVDGYFPDVAVDFATYYIEKVPDPEPPATTVSTDDGEFPVVFDPSLFYIPNVLNRESVEIHRKVVIDWSEKLPVERDYVTCHNIIMKRMGERSTLSREKTERHIFPVLHTNRQIWYSSIKQEFSDAPKVMWTRSGYTKPFFDPGTLGVTDMSYFVRVGDESAGQNLAANMNSLLMQYIYKTAKWSGFGHERVFDALPSLPTEQTLTDEELFDFFDLSEAERLEVKRRVGGD
jgi:hypothetical protein